MATAGMVAVAFAWRPELYTVDHPVPVTCRKVENVEYCLHRANLSAMDDTISTVQALGAAGLDPVIRQVTDDAAADVDHAGPNQVLLRLDPAPRESSMVATSLQEEIAFTVSTAMTSGNCAGRFELDIHTYDFLTALNVRVLQLGGFSDLADRVASPPSSVADAARALDAEDIARFMTEQEAQIRNCTATPDLLIP